MAQRMMEVSLDIIHETEKAYLVELQAGYALNTQKNTWIPKSVCKTREHVATTDYQGNPLTYGKRVSEIPEWLYDQIARSR